MAIQDTDKFVLSRSGTKLRADAAVVVDYVITHPSFPVGGGGGSAAWGGITGTLSAQGDLVAALAGKQDVGDYQPLSAILTATTASFTTAQSSKMAGIATGATANSSDATLLNRANHTGTQSAGTITGLAAVATSGAYSSLTGLPSLFDGVYGSLTGVPSTFTPSAHGHVIADVTGLQAALDGKQAAGSYQPLAAVLTGTTASFTTAQETKLSGIATGATANDTDANLRARASHTGTQAASTISDFASAARAQTEAELVAGANVTITPSGSGATRQLTIASTGIGGAAAGTATINFGAFPGSNEASVTFVDAAITGGAKVQSYIMAGDTTGDHTANDHRYAGALFSLSASASAGVGGTIYARSIHKMQGTFAVRWTWAA